MGPVAAYPLSQTASIALFDRQVNPEEYRVLTIVRNWIGKTLGVTVVVTASGDKLKVLL